MAKNPNASHDSTATAESTAHGDEAIDVSGLSYEQAREELIGIVAALEAGQAPLEDSMAMWRRGEALAKHCSTWLDSAQAEIEKSVATDD